MQIEVPRRTAGVHPGTVRGRPGFQSRPTSRATPVVFQRGVSARSIRRTQDVTSRPRAPAPLPLRRWPPRRPAGIPAQSRWTRSWRPQSGTRSKWWCAGGSTGSGAHYATSLPLSRSRTPQAWPSSPWGRASSSPTGRLLLGIPGSFAEFERSASASVSTQDSPGQGSRGDDRMSSGGTAD